MVTHVLIVLPHNVILFGATVVMLTIGGLTDLTGRVVPNRLTYTSIVVGGALVMMTGCFVTLWLKYVIVGTFVVPVTYFLFRIGAIGGGDAKILLAINIMTPGFVFVEGFQWTILEVVTGYCGVVMPALTLAILTKNTGRTMRFPLVPFFLVAYVSIQMALALVLSQA